MHFGEGGYEESEMAVKDAASDCVKSVPEDLVPPDEGFEAQADWQTLGSPESYLGYEQGQNFVSANTAEFGEPQDFGVPERLQTQPVGALGELDPGAREERAQRGKAEVSCSASTRATSISSWARPRHAQYRSVCASTVNRPAMRTGSTSTKRATERSIDPPGSINWFASEDRSPTAPSRSPSSPRAPTFTASRSASGIDRQQPGVLSGSEGSIRQTILTLIGAVLLAAVLSA